MIDKKRKVWYNKGKEKPKKQGSGKACLARERISRKERE